MIKMAMEGRTFDGKPIDPMQVGQGPRKTPPRQFRTVELLAEWAAENVRRTFLEDEDHKNDPNFIHRPMVWAVCRNGDVMPIFTDAFDSEKGKSDFADTMRAMFKVWNVERYVQITEAWLAAPPLQGHDGEPTTYDHSLPPSQQPDRIEVVMVTAHGKRGKFCDSTLEMIRDPVTKCVVKLEPYFKKLTGNAAGVIASGMHRMGGRFGNMLEDPKPIPSHPAADESIKHAYEMMRVLLTLGDEQRNLTDAPTFERLKAEGLRLRDKLDAAWDALIKTPFNSPDIQARVDALETVRTETQPYGEALLRLFSAKRGASEAAVQ